MLYFLSQFFTVLILPPGLFVVLGCGCIIFLFRGNRKIAIVLAITTTSLTFFLSMGVVRNLLIKPLELKYPPFDPVEILKDDVIVVLGGGVVAPSPEEQGESSLAKDSLKRLIYGFRIQKQTGLPIIVSGGKPLGGRADSFAQAAGKLLEEFGVEESAILLESTSRTTLENAKRVKESYDPSRVVLVTSAHHMPRSARTFRRAGMEVIPAPTDYKAAPTPFRFWDFLPAAQALRDSIRALHEYVGLVYYTFLR